MAVAVAAGVAVAVGLGVGVGVAVGVGVKVAVGVGVSVGVGEGVLVGVAVGEGVTVNVCVGVGVAVAVVVGIGVLVAVGISVAVGVGVAVGSGAGPFPQAARMPTTISSAGILSIVYGLNFTLCRPSVPRILEPEQPALSEREQQRVGAERVDLPPLSAVASFEDLEGEAVVQLVVRSGVGEVESVPVSPPTLK